MSRIAVIVAIGVVCAGLGLCALPAAQGQERAGKESPLGQNPQPDQQARQTDAARDKVQVSVRQIPSFMQAGRSYVFEPVAGERFSGRVVSLDATGWVQVQHRPGGDVGPLAEWYNLGNMVSIKAMN